MRLLILSDGKPGHLNQSLGIAERIAEMREVECTLVEVRHKSKLRDDLLRVFMRLFGWALIPSRLARSLLAWSLTPQSASKLPVEERFDLILSTGSSVAAVNLLLRRVVNGRSVVSLRPYPTGITWFDLVILPRHLWPRITRRNVFKSVGVPNRVTSEAVSLLKSRVENELGLTPRPRIGVLLGGEERYNTIRLKTAESLVETLISICREIDGELFLTTSRRTPDEVEEMLERRLSGEPRCRMLALAKHGTGNIKDAVPTILAVCDLVIVTEDSLSMVSEAASSGRKIVILRIDRKTRRTPRRVRMYEEICRRCGAVMCDVDGLREGIMTLSGGDIEVRPLRDAEGAACEIVSRFSPS
jgi:hypothetical protein